MNGSELGEGVVTFAALVVYKSVGKGPWLPVKQTDVPTWVKEPDTMARLVKGEMVSKDGEGDVTAVWWMARRFSDLRAMGSVH